MAAQDALNPRQHQEYLYSREEDEDAHYTAIRRTTYETGEVAHHQVGTMRVERHEGEPEQIGKSWNEGGDTKGRLFEYTPQQPDIHSVEHIAGTRAHRVQNMTMLGMAANRAKEMGAVMGSSSDLSQHSSRLLEHLKGTGAVSQQTPTKVTNNIQFHVPYPLGRHPYELDSRVSQGEVEAGRQTIRTLLRGDRPAKPEPPRQLPGQGSLF